MNVKITSDSEKHPHNERKAQRWELQASLQVYNITETFRFKDDNDYECEISFKVFSRIVKK